VPNDPSGQAGVPSSVPKDPAGQSRQPSSVPKDPAGQGKVRHSVTQISHFLSKTAVYIPFNLKLLQITSPNPQLP
jgi:hypothetical protein